MNLDVFSSNCQNSVKIDIQMPKVNPKKIKISLSKHTIQPHSSSLLTFTQKYIDDDDDGAI